MSDAEELSSDDLVLVGEERVSLLSAAQNARSVAMLTGTHGVVAAPLSRAALRLPPPRAFAAEAVEKEGETGLTALLRARVLAVSEGSDAVAKLRARLELACAKSHDGDVGAARAEAEAASRAVEHAPAAHAMLRALSLGRDLREEQLEHVENLVAHGAARADFLAEKGRLLEAGDGASADSVAAFAAALAETRDHAGALYGLEAALDATSQWEALADHLGRLADLAGDLDVAAWLHVERALLLDRRLGDAPGARAALDRALALSPGKGPVRDTAIDDAVKHRDDVRLAVLLEGEAAIESDPARAARLELDAALAHLRTGADPARALKVLERAYARAPTTPLVDTKIAYELAPLLATAGRHSDVLRVRKSALRLVTDPREEVLLLRAVAEAAERAGELDDAVLALERARVLEGDDATLLADLDRVLAGAGRHEARAVTWMRESARCEEPQKKAHALLVAAAAARAAGRDSDAAKYLQSAWIAAPGAPGVFDALAERLAPPAARAAVEERVALYEQAARATSDERRKLYFLEKIAWLWDDVVGDAAAAARAYEDVLAIDPARASAVSGLASAATRAGDAKRLARALIAEADATKSESARAEVRLRAAETLADVDPERALALAQALDDARAAELVTSLHARAGRWDLAAASLAARRKNEEKAPARIALALAEALLLSSRLGAHDRALSTLAEAREDAPSDPALAHATIAALEATGDTKRLRDELAKLADAATTPLTKGAMLVRAAELEEGSDDARAVALYEQARAAMPNEPLLVERLVRLGARAEVPADLVPRFAAAARTLEVGDDHASAEPLLASDAQDFPTLRLAERLARRSRSAPQLANALAMQVDATRGTMALRALSGLAALVAWTLPESEDVEPWDRLVALGSRDAVVLDTLAARAMPGVRGGDARSIELATEATRRRLETAGDDTERLVLRLELARLARRRGDARQAAIEGREALAIDEASVSAAALLGDAAGELGDRTAAVAAAKALAAVVIDAKARAELLRDAADLSAALGDPNEAAALLERALDSDPDAVLIAARLAQLQAERGAWADLARALRRGLAAATSADAIVPMASELADVARTRLDDPLLAIESLERARAVTPGHVPSLFNLAELYIGQRAWDRALEALGDIVEESTETEEKLIAHAGRASIFGRALARNAEAEAELRAALVLDPHDARSIRALLKIPDAVKREERAELLSRLVIARIEPNERLATLLELAELRRDIGDVSGAEGALVEAASLSPDTAMLGRLRAAAGNDTAALARILGRASARARESGNTPAVAWLVVLGDLEFGLGRFDDAIERFDEALRIDPTRDGARLSLARAHAKRGDHKAAAAALAPLIDNAAAMPMDHAFVRLLDETLTGAGQMQQAEVAKELRAIAGDLDAAGTARLRSRRPVASASPGDSIVSGRSLRALVMPSALAKHAIWDVAALTHGLSGKLARVGLADQGVTAKDRIKPKAVHPLRQLFDRLTRTFEIEDVELAVSDHVHVPVIAAEDTLWIVAPSSIVDWPEPHAAATLARPLARIALGVPWFGVLSAHEVLAILVAVARQVAPSFSATPRERVEPLVADYETRARRAIDRRRRRALEELEPALAQATAVDEGAFADAIARTEARAAFLLSGDLRATLDAVASTDPTLADSIRVPGPNALGGVLAAPLSRDLVSFALSSDAIAIRRSLGTLWG